jgi:hypothetical protein
VSLHGQAFARGKIHPLGGIAPHHAANGGVPVFEGEIEMAGGWAGKVGNFTFHPNFLQDGITF